MCRNRKHFIHNTLVEVTSRVQEGLPFIPTRFMRLILESELAKAQQLYPVRLTNLMVMGNHIHLHLLVEDPEDVSHFVGYFKRETAHAVNRLIGRVGHTVWAEGYDSPIILDAEKAIERLVYFYTNPQSARLVRSIEDYPQLSTWNEFISGRSATRAIPTFPRRAVPKLTGPSSERQDEEVLSKILSKSEGSAELCIEPFAWLPIFADTAHMTPSEIIEIVTKRVKEREAQLDREKGSSVIGRAALLKQDFRIPHQPKKRGKRMICLASDKVKRTEYLGWFFSEVRQARRAFENWVEHNGPLIAPPGFFAPGQKMFANIFPQFLFF